MGRKQKAGTEKAPAQPPAAPDGEPVTTEEHEDLKAAKARAKAADGSVFEQDAVRLRRDLFGHE